MIEIEYIVRDQKGAERLRTTDKKAADAYDKALESAERLAELIRRDGVLPNLPESDLEELTIYLVRNARNVERILRGKEPELEITDEPSVPSDKVARLRATG
ncbi:MAG: hypothetical protein EOM91_02060 [Sphingobacteriia bacterium]|nr:hypothetical protein [Sphingobacteriia bacterium]NCC38501.1 hypothetical protein [Gammaproteobacteria bacterium]